MSDNGTDADGDNGTGGFDDPTPFLLSQIGLAKAITNVSPAASGIEGNYDVKVKYTLQNTGTSDLSNVSLMDDISTQWGPAFVGVTGAPVITLNEAKTGCAANGAHPGSGE